MNNIRRFSDMKRNNFLLSDEEEIEENDYQERKKIIQNFSDLPNQFWAKLRHLQPQIGCLNACEFCSKEANVRTEYWSKQRQRNVIAALKYSAIDRHIGKPFITWDRSEHRNGVVFSYLDNDVGNYFYLDEFISLVYNELGVKTRISTVGYSRHNEKLNNMHKRINVPDVLEALGGVRLSFTPYEMGWRCEDKKKYSQYEYTKDMANFLSIYRPCYDKLGCGRREMCVELRYKPLVITAPVYILKLLHRDILCSQRYMYISVDCDICMKESKISDADDHRIKLTNKPEYFYQISLQEIPLNIEEVKEVSIGIIKTNLQTYSKVEIYLLKNEEGDYYAVEPSLTEYGNYGINMYPKTSRRKTSGVIITERFLLNAIFKYKRLKNLSATDKFMQATWNDIQSVLQILRNEAEKYKNMGNNEKARYITEEIFPMINAYVVALQEANYSARDFFDPDFTIDTGIICNLGRALSEFKGITTKADEPLTPSHERNYGKYNSLMTKEGVAWRLSCDYEDKLTIERLNLFDTASEQGQVAYRREIQLGRMDESLTIESLQEQYLIPGQRGQ